MQLWKTDFAGQSQAHICNEDTFLITSSIFFKKEDALRNIMTHIGAFSCLRI